MSGLIEINGLTPAQHERLALLLEELGEAQQSIGKILRHGYFSHHPDTPEWSNRDDLERELGHVQHAVSLLVEQKDLRRGLIETECEAKRLRVGKYLHHQ